jgi:hypothetical protein
VESVSVPGEHEGQRRAVQRTGEGPLKSFPELATAGRRALPDGGEEIERLDPTSRVLLANAWAVRARSELDASSAFATMLHGIIVLDVEPSVRWLTARAVCDELRHSEICRHMATCYGSKVEDRAPPRRVESASGGPIVQAVANCAISETIASAFLSRSLEQAQSDLSHAVVRELLEDEVDHSRIGWALLSSLDKREQGDLTTMLPQIVRIVRGIGSTPQRRPETTSHSDMVAFAEPSSPPSSTRPCVTSSSRGWLT